MSKAEATARYLLHLASEEPDTELVTHLRLQKLLYYVQGYSLALRDRPMFDATIQAWRHGPVVREVYPLFADYENAPLPPEEGQELVHLTNDEKAFVRSVWEHHKQYSASALWRMTHQEPPWRQAWGNRPPHDKCDEAIPQEAMRTFFKQQLQEQKIPGLEPEKLEQADREARAGNTVSIRQLASKLGMEDVLRHPANGNR